MGSPDSSDNELLKGLISRDESVLRKFYSLYFRGIRRFVRANRGNDEDAQDLFQDAMLVLYQKVRNGDFILTCSPGTYLYSVSRYIWFKELDKRKRMTGKLIDIEDYIDTDNDVIRINEKNERLLFFRKCLGQLPEDCRKVLELFVKGFSIARITTIMGYGSEQYTRNRRYRCKSALISKIKSVFD